ncbi:hypothetical protein AAFF_G00119230 [Aldrovandia affinis]|uniref:5-hydroxytryptamine receptor 7 n=1 Tax=Aldrovandia affinis TaxID=143900 RepID=A0AAD7WAI2_9TELE|nr:hypothetical protein AAFF_G00119230 [Aldrovandia affinis]
MKALDKAKILKAAIGGHGKTTLFDRFCAGDIDEHMDIFLDIHATKDVVIRAGIAIFQHIYHAPGTTLGAIRYNMFSRKAAAGLIKPETLPPTEGAATQHSLRADLQTRDWMLLQSMSLDPSDYGWMVGVHGYEPVPTLDPMAPEELLRYLGIMRPLTYPVRQNGKLMAKMVLTVWLLSASITLPPLFGWATNVTAERVCLISQDLGYTVYSTTVAFYIPTAVMLLMYYRIYRAAQVSAARHKFISFSRRSSRLGRQTAAAMPGEVGAEQRPAMRERLLQACAALSRLLRPDRRQASVFKREQKAARTLGVIMGAFTFCWLPFFLLSAARPFVCGVARSCVPIRLERTLLWLGYANSLLNPLIYAAFNRDLRATYWNLLHCRYRHINRRLSAAGMHEALKAKERPHCIV